MNQTSIKDVSIIIVIGERYNDIETVFQEYKTAIESSADNYEFIYVIDGKHPKALSDLKALKNKGESIRIFAFSSWFGEAAALRVGFEHARADTLVTLPAYLQVKPDSLPKLLESLDGNDMVIGKRWPRVDSRLNQVQTKLFHKMQSLVTDNIFSDMGCGVRAFSKKIANEVSVYGDQHRFFPLLASQKGFRVAEIELPQSELDMQKRLYKPGVYLRRLLDILTVFFLVKFTKKPLRFFGLIGSIVFILGLLFLAYVVFERIFFGMPLADRPALLLSSLFIVLGVQVFVLGLIGELVIFTHATELDEYEIEEVIE
jgi:glycosyltransferase involved in cell wall biosynthesis